MILNLQSADTELSKLLIDFASGLTYALDGSMQRSPTRSPPHAAEVEVPRRSAPARSIPRAPSSIKPRGTAPYGRHASTDPAPRAWLLE